MKLAENVFPSRTWTPLAFGAAAILAGWLISILLPDYLVYLAITAIVATVALMGLGVVSGTAGMIVLSQLTFSAVGAWVVCTLNEMGAPGGYIVWLLLGAIAAGLVGVILGLPALRLRGVNLAVVTLGFAAAADLTLQKTQFPGAVVGLQVPRPAGFTSDRGFFLFSVIVLVAVAVGVFYLQNSRIGSGWRAVAFSERGTAAAGASVRWSKLTAFATSATIAGLAGGLIAGQVGAPYPINFATLQSLTLYVLSIVAGAHLVEKALFGGILWVLIPELLKRFGISQDWGLVIFGLMGIQALTTNSTMGQDLRNAIERWQHKRRGIAQAQLTTLDDDALAAYGTGAAPSGEGAALEVRDVAVTFGSVKALDGVTLTVREREIVGLIGPNGAGKSTLVDVVSGFLPRHTGTVLLSGRSVDGLGPDARARAGLRRTFQQDRVPPSLSVGDYIAFVSQGASTPEEIRRALEFFGCPDPRVRIHTVDVGTRRLIEVAANLLAKPEVLVLDEPAAGLSHDEHVAFGQRLRLVPEMFGAAILIIEHDLDLVRTVCSRITVLDFGSVLASGTVDEVLDDPAVAKAYMGETELL